MEYYYGEALRWTYGFDNPNKAAVLFASGLPLAWMLWMLAWRGRSRWGRGLALAAAAGLVLGTAFLLCKTYSRGGAVAGAAALAYLLGRSHWRKRASGGRWRWMADAGLVGAVGLVFWGTGLAGRSVEPMAGGGDASVENRLVLWRSALQMAADHLTGFGAGRSGEAYMQWYQPLEMTMGYRTMVNSYLTALVEWGWLPFAASILLAGFFWGWANPGGRGSAGSDVAGGLRGTILAFAVAGIFSTTMEEPGLWILPGLGGVALAGWAAAERRSPRDAGRTTLLAAAGCMVLGLAGVFFRAMDGERREFKGRGKELVVAVGPKESGREAWAVVPDAGVLGAIHGKLLRPLAAELGGLRVADSFPGGQPRVILAGESVRGAAVLPRELLVLLAPVVVSAERAGDLLGAARRTVLFVPEIDEDGRAEFWTEAAADRETVEVVTIEGVGNQVDWGWDQVIERLRAERP